MKLNNVFYFSHINTLGGVETFFYELVKKYSKYDITILYKTNDRTYSVANNEEDQIKRLSKYAKVRRYTGGKIVCKKIFFNYDISIIDNVIADEYINIIHADFLHMNMPPATHPKINKYIGVSKLACESFTKLTGLPAELCYNPISIDKTSDSKPIKLVSATRLTVEKGKQRIERLSKILDNAGIDYKWTIFTNDTYRIKSNNIVYKNPTLSIRKYMSDADFVVQLSDCESYCYTIVESLCLGTPVIVTDLPILKELKITEKQAIILPFNFNMEDVPLNQISKGKSGFKFKWNPPEDEWEKFLDTTIPEEQYSGEKLITVQALPIFERKNICDIELKRVPKNGEIWNVTQQRLEVLLHENAWKTPLVKVLHK